MIALHIWPEGLALVVDAGDQRMAAAFDADGWRQGAAVDVFPEGPPQGAQTLATDLPHWLTEQILALPVSHAGMHTDFVRLDRLVARLEAQRTDGVLLVLGEASAAAIFSQGACAIVRPRASAGAPALSALRSARGWIVLLTGVVTFPSMVRSTKGEPAPKAEVSESVVAAPDADVASISEVAPITLVTPAPQVTPAPEVPPPALEVALPPPDTTVPVEPSPPGPLSTQTPPLAPSRAGIPGEDRFIISSTSSLPDDVAAELRALAGDAAVAIVPLLDGTRTVADVAAVSGLSVEETAVAIRLLVTRKIAFRYLVRARPATGVRGPR